VEQFGHRRHEQEPGLPPVRRPWTSRCGAFRERPLGGSLPLPVVGRPRFEPGARAGAGVRQKAPGDRLRGCNGVGTARGCSAWTSARAETESFWRELPALLEGGAWPGRACCCASPTPTRDCAKPSPRCSGCRGNAATVHFLRDNARPRGQGAAADGTAPPSRQGPSPPTAAARPAAIPRRRGRPPRTRRAQGRPVCSETPRPTLLAFLDFPRRATVPSCAARKTRLERVNRESRPAEATVVGNLPQRPAALIRLAGPRSLVEQNDEWLVAPPATCRKASPRRASTAPPDRTSPEEHPTRNHHDSKSRRCERSPRPEPPPNFRTIPFYTTPRELDWGTPERARSAGVHTQPKRPRTVWRFTAFVELDGSTIPPANSARPVETIATYYAQLGGRAVRGRSSWAD